MFYFPNCGLREYIICVLSLLISGKSLSNQSEDTCTPYSKFEKTSKRKPKVYKLPSRFAMVVAYFPALLLILGWTKMYSTMSTSDSNREFVFTIAIGFHFFKRVVESLFIHNYSGVMDITVSISIAVFYCIQSFIRLYYQQKVPIEFYEQHSNVFMVGIVLSVIGQIGNAYHHWLQSTWKRGKDKKYVVPHSGLFTMIACPHYLFEIISFWGLSLISQDIVGVFLTFPVMGNLTGRSIATTKYYLSKLEDYPKTRKHLIPLFF